MLFEDFDGDEKRRKGGNRGMTRRRTTKCKETSGTQPTDDIGR